MPSTATAKVATPNSKKQTSNAKTKLRLVTNEHKQAMAIGRETSRAVDAYLKAINLDKPKRGRRVSPETLEKRIGGYIVKLETAVGVARLSTLQKLEDDRAKLASLQKKAVKKDISKLEADFIKAARGFGERKGISYTSWIKCGVSPEVLKKAGIKK